MSDLRQDCCVGIGKNWLPVWKVEGLNPAGVKAMTYKLGTCYLFFSLLGKGEDSISQYQENA